MKHIQAWGPVLLICGAAFADEGSYDIRLQRSFKVGDRWSVSGTATRGMTRRVGPKGAETKLEEDHLQMTFKGEVEVLEVGDDGLVTKAECVVEECEIQGFTEEPHHLKKGTKILVESVRGEPRICWEDGRVTNNDLLAEFLPVEATRDHSEDEVFGSKFPRRIGDSWAIVSELFAKELEASFPSTKVDPKDVAGTVKLIDAADVEGVTCLLVEARCEVARLDSSDGWSKFTGTLTASEDLALPMDASQPLASDRQSMRYNMVKTPRPGSSDEEEITLTFSRVIARRRTK